MTALLTPYDRGNASPRGKRIWRKQLLPVGEIDYKGRKIAFTREYLADLANAFRSRAYDQVPFQIAPGDNSHSNDPERFRGEIAALELTDDGLDVIVAATKEGDALLRQNPQLGVSARIVEQYQRADGKFFSRALQHVLGTLDPRITGMRGWEAVEAANGGGEVIDLTDHQYAPDQKETGMGFTEAQEARLAKLLDLPDDEFDALIAPAAADKDDKKAEDDGDGELTDAELDDLLASLDDDEDSAKAEEVPDGELAGAALTAEQQAAIDLANARADETAEQVRVMQRQLDAASYEKERDTLARVHGVPPRITDLARSLLEGADRTVELSNGDTVDAGKVVRDVLTEFARTAKMLDLSVEAGSATGRDLSEADEQARAEERDSTIAALKSMTGVR